MVNDDELKYFADYLTYFYDICKDDNQFLLCEKQIHQKKRNYR